MHNRFGSPGGVLTAMEAFKPTLITAKGQIRDPVSHQARTDELSGANLSTRCDFGHQEQGLPDTITEDSQVS